MLFGGYAAMRVPRGQLLHREGSSPGG
jgi:hypothetical protein